MSEYSDVQKNTLLSYFEKIEGDQYWRTIDEISRETNLDSAVAFSILSNSGEFVRSSYRSKGGEPLFTTRKLFRNKAPFVDKIIGVFKNRID